MKHPLHNTLIGFCFLAAACPATYCAADGFTVIKNVNTDAPVEKVVIFDKSQPADHLIFVDDANCKMTRLSDGSIESRVVGNTAIKPTVQWKPTGAVPETFDSTAYDYLILTFRLEGTTKQTEANGRVRDVRGDNLWLSLALYDAKGGRTGLLNLADFTEDGKTPAEVTTVRIPLSLVANPKDPAVDPHHIKGIGFYWDKTRSNINRDFRIIVDKIALAD